MGRRGATHEAPSGSQQGLPLALSAGAFIRAHVDERPGDGHKYAKPRSMCGAIPRGRGNRGPHVDCSFRSALPPTRRGVPDLPRVCARVLRILEASHLLAVRCGLASLVDFHEKQRVIVADLLGVLLVNLPRGPKSLLELLDRVLDRCAGHLSSRSLGLPGRALFAPRVAFLWWASLLWGPPLGGSWVTRAVVAGRSGETWRVMPRWGTAPAIWALLSPRADRGCAPPRQLLPGLPWRRALGKGRLGPPAPRMPLATLQGHRLPCPDQYS